MNDLKRARQIMGKDPEGALALLERHPLPSPDSRGGTRDEVGESKMRIELYERLGRREAAAAEQARLTRYLEGRVEYWDGRWANNPQSGLLRLNLSDYMGSKARYLELLGRRAEACRCDLLSAAFLLARAGDEAAKAHLEALQAAVESGSVGGGTEFAGNVL